MLVPGRRFEVLPALHAADPPGPNYLRECFLHPSSRPRPPLFHGSFAHRHKARIYQSKDCRWLPLPNHSLPRFQAPKITHRAEEQKLILATIISQGCRLFGERDHLGRKIDLSLVWSIAVSPGLSALQSRKRLITHSHAAAVGSVLAVSCPQKGVSDSVSDKKERQPLSLDPAVPGKTR